MNIERYLRNGISGLALIALPMACNLPVTRHETSDTVIREGIVSELKYTERHAGIGPKFDVDSGVSLGLITVPEEYKIELDVQDIDFDVIGNNDEIKSLYNGLTMGEHVNVSYREVFKVVYQDTNRDGKKEVLSREFIRHEFISASKLAELDISK